jgi:hypothetical protein
MDHSARDVAQHTQPESESTGIHLESAAVLMFVCRPVHGRRRRDC